MNTQNATSVFDSPVGPLYARAEAGKLAQLSFWRRGAVSVSDAAVDPTIDAVRAQVGEYFAGRRSTFSVALQLNGPEFYRRVWTALCDIPYGETISYGELARRVGEPDAARAVGAANGANPIVIIVPCHRVIGADGKLVGYGGGLARKRKLLDLESGSVSLL